MEFVDILIVAVLAAILGLAARYVYKSRKSGRKCIGCPSGGNCSGNCGGNCGCSGCVK